jgi:WD40 repeat protein
LTGNAKVELGQYMFNKKILSLCITLCLLFMMGNEARSSSKCPQIFVEGQCEQITEPNIAKISRLGILGWGSISDLAWPPSGSAIAVATGAGIWLYDPLNPSLLPTYLIHQNGVTNVSYSGDGSTILSTSLDQGATLWNAHSGEEKHRLPHTNTRTRAIFVDQDIAAISIFRDSAVMIWNPEFDIPAMVTQEQVISPVDIAYSSELSIIAVANSNDGSAVLFDRATGMVVSRLALQDRSNDIRAIAFHPDGSMIASAGRDGVSIWSFDQDTPIQVILPFSGAVNTVAFSPDGSMLGYGDTSGTVYVWDPEDDVVNPIAEAGSWVTDVAFSPDSTKLAAATADGTILVWDADSKSIVARTRFGHGESVNDIAFSPEGTYVASGGEDSFTRLWDIESGLELSFLEGDSRIEAVAFSPTDELLIASGGSNGTITLWDALTNVNISRMSNPRVLRQHIAFDPTGELLATVSVDVTVWNAALGEEVLNMQVDNDWPVYTVEYSPLGNVIAFATVGTGTIYLWQESADSQPVILGEHGAPASTIAFNPNENLLVTGGQNILNIWDLETHQLLQTWAWNSGEITDADFNSDGSLLIFSTGDTFRILNMEDQTELIAIKANFGGINSVEFNSDDTLIATAGYDGTIQLWGISTAEEK